MDDVTILEATDPVEVAEELNKFSHKYAQRTGDYEMAGTLMAAAEWLIFLSEKGDI